jgi:hypothetical protein
MVILKYMQMELTDSMETQGLSMTLLEPKIVGLHQLMLKPLLNQDGILSTH